MRRAPESINQGMPVLTAAKRYDIPRRTLRNHVTTGSFVKKLGRSSILTVEQENELCQRIIRLGNIGVPLTNKIIRKSVYTFANTRNIRRCFNREKEMAGRKWIKLFFARHPEITERSTSSRENLTPSTSKVKHKNKASKSKKPSTESWYCFICKEDRVLDMRLCVLCCRYVHEECVGLCRDNKTKFVCETIAKFSKFLG